MNWWQRLRKSNQLETELDAELRFHVQTQVDESTRNGLSEAEARRRARIDLGGLDQVKEDCRDARGIRWLEDLGQDLRFAMRLLTKQRSATLVAAIVLALGIGVNGIFLTLVDMVCLRGLPLDRPDRIMFLATRDARERSRGLSYGDFEDVRATARSFKGLAAFAATSMAVGNEGEAPDRFAGTYISADGFRLIGKTPTLGRDFQPDDDRLGAPPVVIIGHSVWKGRYGADPLVVGRTIRVNGVPSVLIGVMPEGFKFPTNAEVWQPLALMPDLTNQRRDARTLSVMGRLVDSVTPADAKGELDTVAGRLSRDYLETNGGVRMTVVPINERYSGNITEPVWLAFVTAGGLVLFIACVNVANLLLIRSTQRAREMAIRGSLGANRRRIVRQLLVESALLAVLGGLAGVALSFAGLRVVSTFAPSGVLPYWMDFTIDRRVFACLLTICLGTTFVFGLVPALHLSGTDANRVLKDHGRTAGGRFSGRRWTFVFIACQFAVALLLLAHSALGIRLLLAAREKDPAIDMAHLLTMSVTLPSQIYRTPTERTTFYERLDERLRGVGSLTSAAIATALPFGGGAPRQLSIDGVPAPSGVPSPTVWTLSIGTRYFATLRLSIVRGRAFDDRDGTAGYESAIVNQRLVEMYFPTTDPIGHRIQLTSNGATGSAPWFTIVGISPTIRQRPLPEPDPIVYLPYRTEPPATAALIVRGPSEPTTMTPALRQQVRALDSDLALYRIMTMEQAVTESQWNGRTSNFLVTLITCIAVGLSAVGLYAVTAHAVVQRTQEIGIRMAIGAQPNQLKQLVLRGAMLRLGVGLLCGLALTMAWERIFANYAGPSPSALSDPLNMTAAVALLVLTGVVASLLPARRATGLDPVRALRSE